jgi:hypothetical protein
LNIHSLPSDVIDNAIAHLDAWLETTRGPGKSKGYGGPVAHWWQQCLLYTGPGLDWRYEGIIAGYLMLWRKTGDEGWLQKARRAGDDLVAGQSTAGHFACSGFELNPVTAGTPHEAACDIGLLLLAQILKEQGGADWERYATAAERNLKHFYVQRLWDSETLSFRDSPNVASFVPNKAATACEALFLLAELQGEDSWVECYALPTLDRIVAYQVESSDRRLDGAIAQSSIDRRRADKYFPLYIARCVPALLKGYHWTQRAIYAQAAVRALGFISQWIGEDGSLPTAIYPNRRVNQYPSWVAPLAEILRAAEAAHPQGFDSELGATQQRLLDGQDQSGGFQTATGFAAQTGGRAPELPDVRDLLHVTGWCAMAFRYLAAHVTAQGPGPAESQPFEAACTFRGRTLHLRETADELVISKADQPAYRWRKGEPWAEAAEPELWLC